MIYIKIKYQDIKWYRWDIIVKDDLNKVLR